MNKKGFVYLKTKSSNILKCYESETMHKPIYYPVESKTNGYVDWNEVEKIFTIDDFYNENFKLKKTINEIREILNRYEDIYESVISLEIQQKCLQIINKVLGDDEKL